VQGRGVVSAAWREGGEEVSERIVNKPPSKKGRGNPNWKKGMQSPNPIGAPKRGESWGEIIKRVGELTPAEAAERSVELAKQFLKIGEGVTLKEAVVLRVYGALLFEPQPGLLNAFMERAEGKMSQPISVEWREEAKAQGYDPDKLIEEFARAMATADVAGSSAETSDSATVPGA
jgi:hypothetical protein